MGESGRGTLTKSVREGAARALCGPARLRASMRRSAVLAAIFTLLAAAAPPHSAAARPSVPACALGGGDAALQSFYAQQLERAERRFGGSRAARRTFATGVAAYVYGLAPVAVRQTVQRFPENQLVSIGTLVNPDIRTVVFPNVDTTYTLGRLNLAKAPQVIDVPDTAGRYYVIQLLDAYSNTFAYIGRRTTGTRAGSLAIVPRGYTGAVPAGLRVIESPTNLIWVLGRTLVRSAADLPAATRVMSGYSVTELGSWAAGRQPPIVLSAFPASPALPVPRNLTVFDALGVALAENPPPAGDGCALEAFTAAGIGPGRAPSLETTGAIRAALEASPRAALDIIGRAYRAENRASRARNNGWLVPRGYIGRYGRNWLGRAVMGLNALGANTRPETVYPIALTDSRGRPLHGRHRYTVRFEQGELPPVGAFWSLAMYGDDLYLVDNRIDRYAIGDRTPGLRRGRDGSLTIHIGRRPPSGGARANWLPAPAGRFRLGMRLYEPHRSVLSGEWLPPPVRRVVRRGPG